MGTPDTFVIVDPEDAKKFLNGDGKPMLDIEMQSRHFGNELEYYYIFGGVAYTQGRRFRHRHGALKHEPQNKLPPEEWAVKFTREDGAPSILARTEFYRRTKLNNSGIVYCRDELTKPVLALCDGLTYVQERRPWCEWEIEFEDGKLIRVTPKKIPTREDLIKEVQETFRDYLLADDHPIAIKYFYDLEQED